KIGQALQLTADVSPTDALREHVLAEKTKRGLTYAALAREIGMTGEGFSMWLRGINVALQPDALERLAQFLELDYDTALAIGGGMTARDRRAAAAVAN